MSALRDKLGNIPLIAFIDDDLYMKLKVTKNKCTQIGLYMKITKKRKDKHIYWISAEEADILSALGILLIE
jgi:hypothetical protein